MFVLRSGYLARRVSWVFLSLVLVGCQYTYDGKRPVNALYCDNYLIYDMCAQDLNGDGRVELVYFEDSLEVFMFRPGAERRVPRNLGLHRCAVAMDPELVDTTSRLFYIYDETSMLEKSDIRGAMLIKYMVYLPDVAACNMRAEEISGAEGA